MSKPAGGFWFHCKMQTIKRSAGRSAVGCAAYRDGERYFDERYGRTRDYTRKKDVVTHFCFADELAPEWTESSKTLWNSAETHENRKNSQLAHEWEIAVPDADKLTDAQREAIARKFCAWLVEEYGVAGSCAIHSGRDGKNPHMHVMMTTREVDENGWGEKVRGFNTPPGVPNPEVTKVRAKAAEIINDALDEAGHGPEQHVDHRSYKERGIDKEPTRHLGPAASAMERRAAMGNDFGSERGDWNRAIIEDRIAEQERHLHALARIYDPDTAPAELSLDTERELERRFGGEWRKEEHGGAVAGGQASPDSSNEQALAAAMRKDDAPAAAIAGELAHEPPGYQPERSAPARWSLRIAREFRRYMRDESSGGDAEPGFRPVWLQELIAAGRERVDGFLELLSMANAARRGAAATEPDAEASGIAAASATSAPVANAPPNEEDHHRGGERLSRNVGAEEPDQRPPPQPGHERPQPGPSSGQTETQTPQPVEDGLAGEYRPIDAHTIDEAITRNQPAWMDAEELLPEEDSDAGQSPAPEPRPEPDRGPDMDMG